MGAKGVLVGNTLYDVKFVDGTCASVFGVCDAAHFTFTDDDDAEEASDALQDLVFIDQGSHPLNTQPNLTFGCPGNQGSTKCDIWTPYEIGSGFIPESLSPVPFIEYASFRNSANPLLDQVYYGNNSLDDSDLSMGDHEVWAVWTPSNPNAIPVTVQSVPAGLQITVDGVAVMTPQSFSWIAGSAHTLGAASPQGTQLFINWSDGGALAHIVSPLAASDFTAIFLPTALNIAPDMTVSMSHSGNFIQGQTGATYSILARNAGVSPTSGTVTVAASLSSGVVATSLQGNGWSCVQPAGPCSRTDVLGAGLGYPAITLTANVVGGAPSGTSSATVSGGGGNQFRKRYRSRPDRDLAACSRSIGFR